MNIPREKLEREAFEKWASEEWEGRSIPDNAWLGWKARAALSSIEAELEQPQQPVHLTNALAEASTAQPSAWTTYAHIHAIGFGKSGLFVKEPGGAFCVPVFFGEAQHISEPFNDPT